MHIDAILIDNDNLIVVAGLRNGLTDEYLNDATVTARLTTSAGADVVGQTWPLALDYVEETNGLYQNLLRNSLELRNGHYYTLKITASGNGLNADWRLIVQAKRRSS